MRQPNQILTKQGKKIILKKFYRLRLFDNRVDKMKTSADIEKILKSNINNLKRDYNLNSLGIFGSFIRDEQNQKSDVDLLVDFKKPISLIKFIKLENDLSKILGIKVDLVMKDALKPAIGKRILDEIKYVS